MPASAIKTLKSKSFFVILILTGLYLFIHLYGLNALPVFADESIYIRWTQLIIDNWREYLFFPLNDGKPPLHMWLMLPFQFIFSDQLYAGRFLSVLVGLGQIFVIKSILKSLGAKEKAQWFGMFLTSILPFWFFHHRMALIDSLLTLFLSLTYLFLIKLTKTYKEKTSDSAPTHSRGNTDIRLYGYTAIRLYIFPAGAFFGLALLSKLPAILFLPIFPLMALLQEKVSFKNRAKLLLPIGISALIGLAIFFFLKIHPAFGQLFSRGGDFLFSFNEILLQGEWRQSFKNIPKFFSYFSTYMTLPILLFSFAGLFLEKIRRKQIILILSTLFFLGPITLLGRVVYPRYLMPGAITLTISAVLAIEALVNKFITREKNFVKQILASLVIIQLISVTIMSSFNFINRSIFFPDTIPFVEIDKIQYLHEWSSGHGILETVQLIKKESQNQTISIATEGYFGTLPDALLMYFHRHDVDKIYIEGIGQPVENIPLDYLGKVRNFDQNWLVVNSHRMKLDLTQDKLIAQFCRPDNAPCLQIWDIKDVVDSSQIEEI